MQYDVSEQEGDSQPEVNNLNLYSVYTVGVSGAKELHVNVDVLYKEKLCNNPMTSTDIRLRSYSGNPIPVVGELQVEVTNQRAVLPLVVAKGEGVAVLGRSWLQSLKIDWKNIFWGDPRPDDGKPGTVRKVPRSVQQYD